MIAEDPTPAPRIIILADYGGSYAGTFISMVIAIVREGRRSGYSAEVIFSSVARERPWLEQLEAADVPYRFAPDEPSPGLRRWLEEDVLRDSGSTILHTHFTKFDVPAALASKGRSNVSVFWHVHSPASEDLRIRARNVVKYALVGRHVKKIFCVAPDIARDVRRRGGSSKRVVFMPNAIDTARFPKTMPDERLEARRQLDLPANATILLHFGWSWQRKGGDIFLRTIDLLTREGTSVLGVSVGGGEIALAAVQALKLAGHVRILEPSNDVRTLYAAADQFHSPSLAEGMPFAMVEALCTGLAVVGSQIPGQVAIAQNIAACRLTGLYPEALAVAARDTLARDDSTVNAEGEAAHLEMLRSFDLTPWAQRLIEHYNVESGRRQKGSRTPRD